MRKAARWYQRLLYVLVVSVVTGDTDFVRRMAPVRS